MTHENKCTVLLSFDFDAESLWATVNMDSPTPMSRGNYGAKVGVPRILDLLDKYHIPSTFFIPADTARRHTELVKEISLRGHEIGHHGDVHESPVNLSRDEEKRVLDIGLETLEKTIGKRPNGYRSPAWDLSPNSPQLLEEYGFLWDSSMMGDDYQFYKIEDMEQERNVIEVPVSWELDDAPHFLFNFFPAYFVGLSAPSKVFEIWSSEFDGAYADKGFFVLTMHPQIIGRYHRIVMLERLIHYIMGHPNVRFSTFTDAVNDWLSWKK